MKLGINLAYEVLKNNLVEAINKSGCPAVLVKLALKELSDNVEVEFNKAVRQEKQEMESKSEAEKDEETGE